MEGRLLNYGSHGIFLRLVTVNLLNACVTRAALYLAGGFHDHRLLLPGWIGIATVRPFPLRYITSTDRCRPSPYYTTSPTRESTSVRKLRRRLTSFQSRVSSA